MILVTPFGPKQYNLLRIEHFRRTFPMDLKNKVSGLLLRGCHFGPCDGQQVGSHNGGPDIGFECLPAFPSTTGKAHTAFEPRNPGLNSSTKASQLMIYIFAAAHVHFFDTALFSKAHVLDFALFRQLQVILRSKTSVKTHLERIALVYLFLTIKHRDGQIHIGWIAALNDTIQNQIGGTTGQTYLVSVDDISAIFDNDIGVWLKDGKDLFLSRDFFSHQHSPSRLPNHPFGKPGIVLDMNKVGTIGLTAQGNNHLGFACIIEHFLCNFKQIDIGRLALIFSLGIHDSQHTPLCPSGVIAKPRHCTELVPYALSEPGQHTYGIPQLARVAWWMNMAFNAGAVGSHLSAFFNALVHGVAQDIVIDTFPHTGTDSFDIAVEGGFLKAVIGDTDAAKPAYRMRIDDMKGQLLIGEVEKNFHDGTSQDLLSAHAVCTASPQLLFASVQILQNAFADGRFGINDGTDRLQLLVLGMIFDVGHQGHLFLPLFAHFTTGSFSAFVDILGCWRFPLYYRK